MIKNIALSVCDQAIFSISNLVISIALLNTLTEVEYGLFAAVYSYLLLFVVCQSVFVLEPALVNAAGMQRNAREALYAVVAWAVCLCSLAILLLSCFFGSVPLGNYPAIAPFAIGAYFVSLSLLFLFRRLSYIEGQQNLSAAASLVYGIMAIVLMFASPKTLYHLLLSLSLAGAVGVASMLSRSKVFVARSIKIADVKNYAELCRPIWKWALLGSLVSWFPGNFAYPLLSVMGEPLAGGHIKAIMILIMPALQFNIALGNFFVPHFVRSNFNVEPNIQKLGKYLCIMTLMISCYAIFLFLLEGQLVKVVFPQGFPFDDRWLFVALVIPYAAAFNTIAISLLKCYQEYRLIFIGFFAPVVPSLLLFVVLFERHQVYGGIISLAVTYCFSALVIGCFAVIQTSKRINLG